MSYDPSNIFAKILRAEIPCDKVFENSSALAFNDLYPKAPLHILVIPKGEYSNFHTFHEKATSQEIQEFYDAISHLIKEFNLDQTGYRLITNCGQNGGQEVPHYHVHLLGGKNLGPLVAVKGSPPKENSRLNSENPIIEDHIFNLFDHRMI